MRIEREHLALGVLALLAVGAACGGSTSSSGGAPDSGADTTAPDATGGDASEDASEDAANDVTDAGIDGITPFCMGYLDSASPFEACEARLCCSSFQPCNLDGFKCQAFQSCLTQCFADGAVGNPDPEDYCDGVCTDADPEGAQLTDNLANCAFDNCQDF